MQFSNADIVDDDKDYDDKEENVDEEDANDELSSEEIDLPIYLPNGLLIDLVQGIWQRLNLQILTQRDHYVSLMTSVVSTKSKVGSERHYTSIYYQFYQILYYIDNR